LLLGGGELEPIATSTLRRAKKPAIENPMGVLEPIATSTLRREKKPISGEIKEQRVQSPFSSLRTNNPVAPAPPPPEPVSAKRVATPVRTAYDSPQPSSNRADNVLMVSTGSETKRYAKSRVVNYDEQDASQSDEEEQQARHHVKPKRKRTK
jgi:hypothetical protein